MTRDITEPKIRTWRLAYETLKWDGLKGFFRGGLFQALNAGISGMLYIGIYEHYRTGFGNIMKRNNSKED